MLVYGQPYSKLKLTGVSQKHIVYMLILLAPVFSNYSLYGKISIGDFFIFCFILYYMAISRFSLIGIFLLILAAALCVVSFYRLYEDQFNLGFYRAVLYYFLVFVLSTRTVIDGRVFLRLYTKLSIFFAFSLIVQWFLYSFFSSTVSLQLPINYFEPDTLKVIHHVFRSGGWFKEPSYFILYITPLLFYLIDRQYYVKYLFLVLAGVISTSSLIFFVVLASGLFYVIRHRKFGLIYVAIPLSVPIVLFFYSYHSQLLEFIFYERIYSIFADGGTLNDRVGNSLAIINNLEGFLPNKTSYDYFSSGGENGSTWFSSVGAIGASFGLLGLILIIIKIYTLDAFFALVLIMFMFSTHIFSGVYSTFIVVAFVSIKNYLVLGTDYKDIHV